ncbi:MAG: heparinase II/III family protein [Lentisphaeria bacterium]|jgi:hypothetical protein|nr:heparinase II/III family protein [Lentisphaeria bacterium]
MNNAGRRGAKRTGAALAALLGIVAWTAEEWRVGPEQRLEAFRQPERVPGETVRFWGFDQSVEDWVPRGAGIEIRHDPELGHEAKGCLRVDGIQEDGWNFVWSPRLEVVDGATYRATMWLRVERLTEETPDSFFFKIEMTPRGEAGGSRQLGSSRIPANRVGEWQEMAAEFTVPDEGLAHIAFALEKGTRDRRSLAVAIDDVRLERVSEAARDRVWRDAALRGPITAALRGVHPRLYLDAERVAYLRATVQDDPRWQPAWRTLLALADAGVRSGPPVYADRVKRGGEDAPGNHEQLWQREVGNRIPHIALAYVLTGEPRYLDSAKAWVFASLDYPTWGIGRMDGLDLAAGHQLAGIGLAYDWLYHDLTAEERARIREKLVPRAARLARLGAYEGQAWWQHSYMQNHQWVSLAGMTTTAFALADEVPETASWICVAHEKFVRTLEIAGDDGTSHEGYGYWEYGAEYIMRYLELADTCLGIDLYHDADGKPHPWLSRNPAYALHLAFPRGMWSKRGSVADIGDCPRTHWYGPSYLLRNLARRYPAAPWQGAAQWQAAEFVAAECDAAGSGHYLNFAWYDDGIPAVSPAAANLPLAHHFPDLDLASARTSWDDSATQLIVKCGPPLGHKHVDTARDYGAGHVHPDAGHFLFSANNTHLFRDSGYTKPKTTAEHSTLLIGGKGQKGEGKTWFDFGPWLRDRRAPRIVAVEKRDGADVIVCDVAPAYPPDLGLTTFARVFTLPNPARLTIADTVALEAAAPLEWRFQVEGTLEPAGENEWLLRQGETTARIRFAASVPIRSETGALPQKGNPPFLAVHTLEPAAAANLQTEITVE